MPGFHQSSRWDADLPILKGIALNPEAKTDGNGFHGENRTKATGPWISTPERFSLHYPALITITATKERESLYALFNKVRESHEPVQITGKQGDAVLISEEEWRSISETLFLHSIPGMVDSIQQALAEGLVKAKCKLPRQRDISEL